MGAINTFLVSCVVKGLDWIVTEMSFMILLEMGFDLIDGLFMHVWRDAINTMAAILNIPICQEYRSSFHWAR